MRYSIEPRVKIYVKEYGFLSFARNIGKNATKVAKSMSNKYCQKFIGSAKKSPTDAIKTRFKKSNLKNAKATGDLIGNIIVDKITNVSTKLHPKSPKELHPQNNDANNKIEVTNKNIYLQKKDNKLLMN